MPTPTEGGCLCGGTRYMLEAELTSRYDCHCVDCRRSSGAPYVTWGTVPRDKMKLTRGSVRTILHASRFRSFAACCGTHLFFAETENSATVDITIASLDDPTPWPPVGAIWTEDRLPWVALDPAKPVYRRSTSSG